MDNRERCALRRTPSRSLCELLGDPDIDGSSASTARPRTLTFGGRSPVTIPAGAQAMSDSLGFAVPPDTNLLVSLHLRGPVQLASAHGLGMQDMYSSADYSGDHTTDVTGFPTMYTFGCWTLLSGIDVTSSTRTVVALGDSSRRPNAGR